MVARRAPPSHFGASTKAELKSWLRRTAGVGAGVGVGVGVGGAVVESSMKLSNFATPGVLTEPDVPAFSSTRRAEILSWRATVRCVVQLTLSLLVSKRI